MSGKFIELVQEKKSMSIIESLLVLGKAFIKNPVSFLNVLMSLSGMKHTCIKLNHSLASLRSVMMRNIGLG